MILNGEKRRPGGPRVLPFAVFLLIAAGLWGALSGCSVGGDAVVGQTTVRSIPMSIELRSDAFEADAAIPSRYTRDGENLSPPLTWTGVPSDAKELVLIVDDPDAPRTDPWVHWVMYKIPATLESLPEGIPATREGEGVEGALQGPNDSGTIGYSGPAPPRGRGAHHYHFKLYALNSPVELEAGDGKQELLAAMEGHVVARGELVATYER